MEIKIKIQPTTRLKPREDSPEIAQKIMEIGLNHFIGPCESIIMEFATEKEAQNFEESLPIRGRGLKDTASVIVHPEYEGQEAGLRWVKRAIEKNVVKVTEINWGWMNLETVIPFLQAIQGQIDSVTVE